MKKLIMFDLDGTILDTEEDLLICANELFDKIGFPRVDRAKIREANGKDAIRYMRTLVGEEVSDEEIKGIFKDYVDLVAIKGADTTKVFDGLEEVLFALNDKGYVLVAVTNKAESELPIFKEKILDKLPLKEVLGVGGTEDAKPSPSAILTLLKKYNIEKQNAYMVGDGEPDIITAINANVNRKKENLFKL